MVFAGAISKQSRTKALIAKGGARGFTLIELMVAVAIVAILASIAMPSYSAYVRRSRVPQALMALLSFQVRMEQRFQDTGNYRGDGDVCAIPNPTVDGFTVACTLTGSGTGFFATATGSGAMTGYTYKIDDNGNHSTEAHPTGGRNLTCWSIRGGVCEG